jgi:hypothetical protein
MTTVLLLQVNEKYCPPLCHLSGWIQTDVAAFTPAMLTNVLSELEYRYICCTTHSVLAKASDNFMYEVVCHCSLLLRFRLPATT